MADRRHPYRRRQYTIEILHVPVSYPLKQLEKDVREYGFHSIEGCRTIKNDSHIKGTYIFYVNFSDENEAMECVDFLKENGYIRDGMWLKEKIREISEDQNPNFGGGRDRRGMGRGYTNRNPRNRGKGFREPDPPSSPGYDIPDIPEPEVGDFKFPSPKPDQDHIIHVKNIPSFVDEDIFKDIILSNREGIKKFELRDDPSDNSLKEAFIYTEDEKNMNRIIANLNHVKVGGKTLEAKPKRTDKKPNNDPADYISPLQPQKENIPSLKETFQKTVKMSYPLFEFIKAKKKAQLDGFTTDGGVIHHEADTLCLKSENMISLNTIYATLTTEIFELIQTFSKEDYTFLTTSENPTKCNFVEAKCSPYKSADQLRYKLNDKELTLHVFGIKDCVDVVINSIENALYYQFCLKSPMDIYISVFPGIIQEILGSSGILRGNNITINSNIGLEECKKIRENIRNVETNIICEPCRNFPMELITSGLKFCKHKHLRVAIIFRDIHGVLYKKYQQDSIVTLCGLQAPLLSAHKVFLNPISRKMAATRSGLNKITQRSGQRGPSLAKNLEQEYSVCVQTLSDSVNVIGFIKDDVDNAAARINKVFDNLEFFLSEIIPKYQVDFFMEAKTFDVQWTMDMLSELELDYDVELVNTGKDYKFKGNQDALLKIENGSAQVIAYFKEIIRQSCSPIQFDKMSADYINGLLLRFFEYQFNNENIFVSYHWKYYESRSKPSTLDVTIDLVGRSIDVNIIVSKIQDFKPATGRLREKFSQSELKQLEQLDPTFFNIMSTEFISFQRKNQNQIDFHSLGISSRKPWDIFDSIMSDQEVVRTVHISPTALYFLRSKKLLKDCEKSTNCTIVEETKERAPNERSRKQVPQSQHDRNVITVKGKHTDVKVAVDILKNWIDNFSSKSISKNINPKMKHFFIRELESLKKEMEQGQKLIIDIRDAKKLLYDKVLENEGQLEFSVTIQTLDKHTCDQLADSIEAKLELVQSDEFPLSDRQLTLLLAANKDQAIPRDQHFYVDIQFKQRRKGSARIFALQHYKEAIQIGMEVTAPYLQFKDQIYSPQDFLKELLFHWKKYTDSININETTLGVQCTRPQHATGNYKLSGNPSAIQKMISNLKNFESSFVSQCDQLECEINIPLKALKSDHGYANLERDIIRNCIVKIFMCGELPDDIDRQINCSINSLFHDLHFDGTSRINRTLCTYTYSNATIEVMKGDITKLDVACIVNAANERLEHDGGIAKAISEAGGPSIQKGCTKYILEHGKLAIGGAVLQGSGNLPCTKLIHVSSALWNPFEQEICIGQLKDCVSTVFQLCETHKLASIAIPGISTGNYGFPPSVSTRAIIRESMTYFDAHPLSRIQRLVFIDINDTIVDSYNLDCQRYLSIKTEVRSSSAELVSPTSKKSSDYYATTKIKPPQLNFPTNASQNQEVEFFWKENDNQFYPYGKKYQDILKYAYKMNPLGSISFQRGEYTYTVDFSTLKQTNTSTNIDRTIKIQHIVNPENTPLPKPIPLPSNIDSDEADLHCYWYFFNEHNTWVAYEHDIAKKLSHAYLNNPQGNIVISQLNKFSYYIDFKTMKQTNQESGTVRTIRVDKNKLESAMGKLAITSSDNVTLFGIQENITSAKNKLDRFVRLKCSSKTLQIKSIPKTVMISTIIKLKKNYSHVKIEVEDIGLDYAIKLDGFKDHVNIMETKLKDIYIQSLEDIQQQDRCTQATFPDNWDALTSNEMFSIVQLVNNSPEWVKVATKFNRTSRQVIRTIERIQNKWLWRKYQQTKDGFKDIEQNENELTVFHGTGATDPELIYKGTEGFDFRHSSKGMWGKANYFAANASFCQSYQYTDPATNANKILQVKLLAGNVVHLRNDSTLTMPPLLPMSENQHFVGRRYDTVSGDHSGGSKIYMVYTNERAYPEYLITYS